MSIQPLTKEQYESLKSGDVDGFVFPEDHSTDGQFLDDIGRRRNLASGPGPTLNRVPSPAVKMLPDHQVSLQGNGVIAKGVPADRKIQFFGLPDYQASGVGDADYGDGPESEEYYSEKYVYESEEENGEETEAGMSTLEKALLASDLAMMGSKVHGWVS